MCVCIYIHIYQVMVATVRCEEIANDKFRQLKSDEVFIYEYKYSEIIWLINNLMNISIGLVGIGSSSASRSCARIWEETKLDIRNLYLWVSSDLVYIWKYSSYLEFYFSLQSLHTVLCIFQVPTHAYDLLFSSPIDMISRQTTLMKVSETQKDNS